ncbi:MAG: orotate phosphoribosyltransferase [Deltaproteobacteria bacterium]|jgi:orotate phosphoribosyltransferase|nr:orotate phosphoribosyltransferase [Deltaproteobacteria bacterium]
MRIPERTDSAAMKKRLAGILVERSYMEGDFTLASGKKSDYYFDCRQTSLHPEGAWLIGQLFNALLADLPVRAVGGMTMGADPLISATSVISHERGRPLAGLIVRKALKDHGTGRYIEGLANVAEGDAVAMLEDVVSTGGSVLQACQRVRDAGLRVAVICCVLDRGEGGREKLLEAGYELRAIFTRKELVTLARE